MCQQMWDKLYFALDHSKPQEQIAYYHPGVGTSPSINDKVFGGAFGDGLDKNIKSAYKWVCNHYESYGISMPK
jgi:uncharacterized protein (DUF2235 family)